MNRREFVFKKIGEKRALVVLVLVFLAIEAVFTFYLTPGFARASGGAEILDISAAYTAERVSEFLSALDAGGRSWYDRIQVLDTLFPAVYGLLLAGILYRLYSRKYDDFSRYSWIVMVPLAGAGADYLENLLIRILILTHPTDPGFLGRFTGWVAAVKFAGLVFSILFILTGIGYFLKGRRDAALAPGERKKNLSRGE